MQLIHVDSSQDDMKTSQADAVEIITVSSDSEPFPRKGIWRVIQKVKFSHPFAHLDPDFLLKKQQHERCMTQSDSTLELVSSLPNTPNPRKHRNEVPHSLTLPLPKAGLIRQPLNPFDSDYQETPPSSSDSTRTQMPIFKVAHG